MSRRLAREALMCLLYEREVAGEPGDETLQEMRDVLHTDKLTDRSYIDEGLAQYDAHKADIDGMIAPFCRSWKLDRLSRVDLSILRLAVLETEYMEGVPDKVAANEAVELAKKYSADKSPGFINGVLGAFLAARQEDAQCSSE